jgi:hypothetical protein
MPEGFAEHGSRSIAAYNQSIGLSIQPDLKA